MGFPEFAERSQAARGHALALVERSRTLKEASRILVDDCRRDQERRSRSRPRSTATALWSTPGGERPSSVSRGVVIEQAKPRTQACSPSFELEGLIEDCPVKAAFEKGALTCDPLLRTHAELVVALGDSFACGPSTQRRTAALEGELAVVLATLMRAMRVTRVEVAL